MTKAIAGVEPSVRRARRDEVDLLRHLHVASLCCVAMRDHSAEDVEAFLRVFPGVDNDLVGSGRYFVCEVAGHVVGAGGWSATRETCPSGLVIACSGRFDQIMPDNSVIIRGFFVHEGAVGKRVARTLMRAIERDAAEAGHGVAIMVGSRASAMSSGESEYRDICPLPLQIGADRVLNLLRLSKRIGASFAAVA